MSEMIERVARAIGAADPEQCGQINDSEMGDYFWEKYRHLYMPMARAAIEAMREPTRTMHEAGLKTTGMPSNTFRDMIDAALKEMP